jgi:pilus assembly protein CpaF
MDERNEYQRVKTKLHRKVLGRLDLQKLASTSSSTARDEVLLLIRSMIAAEAVPLSAAERERLAQEICDEIFGLGPLEPLLKDPTISDILVNAYDKIYVERAGKLKLTELGFRDDQHLMQIINRIVSGVGRRVDESMPMVDAPSKTQPSYD